MNKKCTVIKDNLFVEDIVDVLKENNEKDETAFAKALRGSKIYLKAQGYIEETEE